MHTSENSTRPVTLNAQTFLLIIDDLTVVLIHTGGSSRATLMFSVLYWCDTIHDRLDVYSKNSSSGYLVLE